MTADCRRRRHLWVTAQQRLILQPTTHRLMLLSGSGFCRGTANPILLMSQITPGFFGPRQVEGLHGMLLSIHTRGAVGVDRSRDRPLYSEAKSGD